jgi:hypothetical protein
VSSISQPPAPFTEQPIEAGGLANIADAAPGWIDHDFSAGVPSTARTVEIVGYHSDALVKYLGVRADGSAVATVIGSSQYAPIAFTVAITPAGIVEIYRNDVGLGGSNTLYQVVRYTE